MAEMMQENVILLVVALLIGLLVAWWVFAASRKTRVEIAPKDAAEGSARRNQALIDAPPAADAIPPATSSLAGAGEAVAPAVPLAMPDVPAPAVAAPVPVPEAAPIADSAEAEPAAAPVPAPGAPPAAPAAASSPGKPGADELTRIKGLGPKLAEQLRALGITSLAQIAVWDDAEIDRIDAQLGRFQGRIRRDDWRTQAGLLVAGDTAGYQAKFGKL
jgi:predicted flap endonuclease-1-like 5' DNA nuclease